MRARARVNAVSLLLAALVVLAGLGLRASAEPTITLSGPQMRGPVTADSEGRFDFGQIPLKSNSVNTFTVTATDDFGNEQSKEISITQLSLDKVVVASVTSRPLTVQEVETLVEDGVIDLDDPENFNVSSFNIVLTIAKEPVSFAIPLVVPKAEPEEGFENPKFKTGRVTGGGSPKIPDTEIIITEINPPGAPQGFVPIPGVIIIEGDIKTLKEFFSVRLLLMNISGIFTLADVRAMITFPQGGLSATLPADGVVRFGDILPGTAASPGQGEREFIVRGDEIGDQPVRVEFSGEITGPGIPADEAIPFSGGANTTVAVKGPPTFDVRVFHPPEVLALDPYELVVEITNTGEAPALYSSLELNVGADAKLVRCEPGATADDDPVCEDVEGPEVRAFGHVFPGDRVRESFTVLPLTSGPISSCIGISDQNIALEVQVGNIGCIVGHFPPPRESPDGIPIVSVLPFANAFGISTDSAVTAFFSELMDETSINGGSFQVIDDAGEQVPGQLRFVELSERTIAIWQVFGTASNRLDGNTKFTVFLSDDIRDLEGNPLANEWTSTFRTTSSIDDIDPPILSLSIEPPVDPLEVIPGQLVELDAYPTDQGSGVARVEVRLENVSDPDAEIEFIDQKTVFDQTTLPCLFAVDSALLDPGSTYRFLAAAYDVAGNRADATLDFTLSTTGVPPIVQLPEDPAVPALQGISIDLTPDVVSSSGRIVRFFLDGAGLPFATTTLPPYQAVLRTTDLPLGPHTVRAEVEDGLGQLGQDEFSFELAINPSRPVVDFGDLPDGVRFVKGAEVPIAATIEDPLGITDVAFLLDDPAGVPLATGFAPFTLDTTDLSLGEHRLYLLATNPLGNQNDPVDPRSFLVFEILDAAGTGGPPAPPLLDPLAPPERGLVGIAGVAPAGSQVIIANLSQGLQISTGVDAAGRFSTQLAAEVGDLVQAVVIDLSVAVDPSAPAAATVPAPPALVALEVAPPTLLFDVAGQSADLAVTAVYDDGARIDVTEDASFESSNTAALSVNGSGRAVAIALGTGDVTVTFDGTSQGVPFDVDIVTLVSLEVDPTSIAFTFLGEQRTLVVDGVYSDGSRAPPAGLTFQTGSASVASVDGSGLVTALGSGSTTIVARVPTEPGVLPATVSITVEASDPPPTVEFLSPAAGADYERGDVVSVTVRAADLGGGVASVDLEVTGAFGYQETRPVAPPEASTDLVFTIPVPDDAPVPGTLNLVATATDSNASTSTPALRSLDLVDATAPTVGIVSPAPDALYNFGDTITVDVIGSDGVGVTELRLEVTGAISETLTEVVAPPAESTGRSFEVEVPFGLLDPEVSLRAYALDAAGNETPSTPVPIFITGADITPPETMVTAVSNPGAGATVTVSYEVTSGAGDLDHVELYFRRNGHGTFNRYTDEAGGNPDGLYTPQAGSTGTIVFDGTRMGGDGTYEFATLGVDSAGNREALPESGGLPTGDPAGNATFATGVPVNVVTTDQELIGPAFDDENLRVDGAVLTVVGSHAFRNVELLNGAVLTHRETTDTDEYSLDLSAWTLTIDDTSAIDLDGRGYIGGRSFNESGRTVGNVFGSEANAGGSHGGLGGSNASADPNPVYGSVTSPGALGSGGGASGNSDGSDGGGLLLLNAINVVVDGAIRSNGGTVGGSASGLGSGGSINAVVRTVSGVGPISADGGTTGGTNNVGGGGGRVALRYLDIETYDPAGLTADGGDGFYGDDGANGTVFLLQEGDATGELVINGQGPGSPFTNLVLPPGESFSSLTLQNGARVIAQGAITLTERLLLRGDSVLTHPDGDLAGLQITAARVVVEEGSAIDATGRGYAPGTGFNSPGTTLGGTTGSSSQAGGSHGGLGAANTSRSVALTYGNPRQPTALGGGGGANGNTDGGAGGGAIRIVASDAVVVHGAVRADGGVGPASPAGMGAGGSVWITTSRIAGNGTISADGGDLGGVNNVGGGGGRVAIEADFVDAGADLAAGRNVTAKQGSGFYDATDATAGTVYWNVGGQPFGDLIFDAGLATTQVPATPLLPIGPGVAQAADATTLTLDGGVAIHPDALVGIRLNPDLAQNETFEIVGNTDTVVTVATPNENGVAFADVASVGANYAGAWRFDTLRLRGGTRLAMADPLRVDDLLAIEESSILTHPRTTDDYEAALDVTATTVDVEVDSSIDVSGLGYRAGQDFNEPGRTLDQAAGSVAQTGGSHGGLGGGNGSAPVYGSTEMPVTLGSGGGASGNTDGGAGGGRIRLFVDTLLLDGAIRSDGGFGPGSPAGLGSGGSVWVDARIATGSGAISADGGNRDGVDNAGGGGGRVALYVGEQNALAPTQLSARGGDGFYADGGAGTVFLRGPGQAQGDLILDAFGRPHPADSTPLPAGVLFRDVTLRGGIQVVATDALELTGRLTLAESSVLSHPQGQLTGLSITADEVIVEPGSAIDVSGRGYSGGLGFNSPGITLGGVGGAAAQSGGSHGGSGAVRSGTPANVYGDPRRPTALGGGGGATGNTDGGHGGGFIRIDAASAVVVDGAIRADGGRGPLSTSGMGAGGSIWITTARIAGDGTVSADGGNLDGVNNVGGGGGRVAIEADFLDPTSDLSGGRNVTAARGVGFYDTRGASAGTVYWNLGSQPYGELIIDSGEAAGTTGPAPTPLLPIGPGLAQAVTAASLTLDGGVTVLPDGLVGIRLNPDATQDETFEIVGNTASEITVITPNENGIAFGDVAAIGATYTGQWRFDDVRLRGGAHVTLADPLIVMGTLSLTEDSLLTHPPATLDYEPDLVIEADTIEIDASSSIDVSAKGYLGGQGFNSPGRTLGNATGAAARAGGSYGGLGGELSGATNPTYGSETFPRDLGSGGGATGNTDGGRGGGRVYLVVDALVVDGAIRADGGGAPSSQSGLGSGGSVDVDARIVNGTGAISANGGTTAGFNNVGGGGGRVAIHASQQNTLPPANVTTTGGDGFYADGTDGTVFLDGP